MLLLQFILIFTVVVWCGAVPVGINQVIERAGHRVQKQQTKPNTDRGAPGQIEKCEGTSPVTWADIGINGSTSLCYDSGRSYYNTTVQGADRVVVTSGIPYHAHVPKNPNEACEVWSYMKVPLKPTKGSSFQKSGMGAVGMAVSGAFFYNHLGNPTGTDDVAALTEAPTFDACHGHADPSNQYHYHKIPVCIPGWDSCGLMGYLGDGFAVFGLNCTGADNNTLTSCYTLRSGADPEDTTSYEFNSTASCDLDQANGYDFGGETGYAYVFTEAYPFIMPGYYGTKAAKICKI